jgi:DNA-binding CsgD family transcriptional regulator
MERLRERDLRGLLGCISELRDLDDPSALSVRLAPALHRLIPSDFVVYNAIDSSRNSSLMISIPHDVEEYNLPFERHLGEHPALVYYQRTHDSRVLQLSSFIARRELHGRGIYAEFFRPLAIEHELIVTLPAAPHVAIGVVLTRDRADFTPRDAAVLDALRPHLVHAYRDARVRLALRTLIPLQPTPREREVIELVRAGRSNAEIAAELGIAVATVKKHLERTFRKLGVENRSAVAQRRGAPDGAPR